MADKRPNVLLIMCDQMRHDCAGFASPDRFGFAAASRTPALDHLAQEGVVFDNAYCASPLCSPARASWLTGLLPHAHDQMLNYGIPHRGRPGYEMRRDVVTLGDRLSAAGYRCGVVGPWHLGDDEHPQHGFNAMWDTVKYVPPAQDAYKQYLEHRNLLDTHKRSISAVMQLKRPLRKDVPPVGVSQLPAEHQQTSWTIDRTIGFCRSCTEDDTPFFAFCSIKDPHPPILPPRETLAWFDETHMPLPDTWDSDMPGRPKWLRRDPVRRVAQLFGEEGCRRYVAYFLALIAHMDNQIGRLLTALDELDASENTIVCFISDHGEMLFEHGMYAKSVMLEGSVRVPWVMRWPAGLPSGQRVQAAVSGVDLMPTLLELAGLQPEPVDGRSLAAPLQVGQEPEPVPVVAEVATLARMNEETDDDAHLAGSVMLRDGDWKHVCHRFDEREELYNLADDPDELQNLATQREHASRMARLRALMAERLQRTGPGAYAWAVERAGDVPASQVD